MIAKAGEYSKESFEITGILTKKGIFYSVYDIKSDDYTHIKVYSNK